MNKRLTQKILAALVVAFFFAASASAQFFGDYVEGGAGATAGQEIDSVTVGAQAGFYAEPDPYFSPGYAPTTNLGLGADQYWRWTITNAVTGTASGAEAAPGTYIQTPAAINDTSNYIEILFGAGTGTITLDVAERNGAVACEGAAQTMTVAVVAEPTVTFSPDNPQVGVGEIGADVSICETDAERLNDVIQLTFTGIYGYQAQYGITVDTLPIGGGPAVNIPALDEDFLGAAGNQVSSNATTLDLAQPTGGFATITNAGGESRSTIYTYTLQGCTDRISRKSDYLSNTTGAATGWTWYDNNGTTIAVTVNPAPVTGPIYHISNLWAL
jgi:hypothetical protein